MLAVMADVLQKFYCHCETIQGEEVFLTTKAYNEAQASFNVHRDYKVAFILDILTPLQMEYRKRHLRPGVSAGVMTLQ